MRKIVLALFFTTAHAQGCFDDLKNSLDEIIQSVDEKTHIGIEVVSLKNSETLYEKNSNKLFIPASNLKLFTGAAALTILGVDYQFETSLFLDSQGNLYLKGSGDPDLKGCHLEQLATQVKVQQIHEICGDVVVDNFDFDEFPQGPGWMWDEPAEYWNSLMDGLTVDHSSIHVWVSPAAQLTEPPKIFLDPNIAGFPIDNRAKTGRSGDLKVDRQLLSKNNQIEVEGIIPLGSKPLEFKIPVAMPSIYAGHILKDLLEKKGVVVKGEVIRRKTPSNATAIATHYSRPLSQIVQHMMKVSDNLYANCLFKKLGQVCLGAPGSWQKGTLALREFLLKGASIDPSEMVILDGSGLSRYNLLSPHQIVQLLKWTYETFKMGSEFEASLPIAGVDGTLQSRLLQAKGKVRAKTGSMTGVTGISGYALTKDGEVLAFSILINGFVKSSKEYRKALEDKICLKLTQFSRDE